MTGTRPRYWQGTFDLGPPRVPPLPLAIMMRARDTGQRFLLSHTGGVGTLVFNLSPTIYTLPDSVTYGPYAGPYLGGRVRLYVSSGTLQGELLGPAEPIVYSPRTLTRNSFQRRMLEITATSGWNPGDAFTFTEIDT